MDTTTTTEPTAGTRDRFLARSGKLAEDTVTVDGETYLVRELSGHGRNAAIALLAAARLKGQVDLDGYQRCLLLHGLADPASPEGARTPLLQKTDLEAAMGLGGGFLDPILERIEQLSGLAVDAEQAAKDFLAPTPSSASTPE